MRRNFLNSVSIILLLMISSFVSAQGNGQRQGRQSPRADCQFIENLTDGQKTQISQLRTTYLEKRLAFRNQMDEFRARKRSLQTQANPDMNEINNVIDQMTQLRATMAKDAAAHRQQVRSILTDEQRVLFDSRSTGPRGPRQHSGRGRF
jgi:Spy/CpxP family protein refolding chaperone